MIKLERPEKPDYLKNHAAQLTQTFLNDRSSSVWKRDEIKQPLLASSHSKCAYCECRLQEEAKYCEIEHFRPKDLYPNDVVEWENLLPSCKRCNVKKGRTDVTTHPIVNPYDDNPKAHLTMKSYRFKAINDIGQNTIDVLSLNDHSQNLVKKRFEIGDELDSLLENLQNEYPVSINPNDRRKINKFEEKILSILKQCQPLSDYAATAATVLVKSHEFATIKDRMNQDGLWTPELAELFNNASSIAFD